MRVGHTYVDPEAGAPARETLDRSVEDFAETMSYDRFAFETPEELLEHCRTPWIRELHDALAPMLERDRSVLSLGSGIGEHEVPFHLEGYDITASEIVPGALEHAQRLFPGFKAIALDALDPVTDRRFDDVLATSLDYMFDDEQLAQVFANIRDLLEPGGRCIFVLRYRDNLATRAIDQVALPLEARLRRRRGRGVVRRQHGFRRTRREVIALARSAGFSLGRTAYAGFGDELLRVSLNHRAPRLYELARRIDRRLHVLSICTVMELKSA